MNICDLPTFGPKSGEMPARAGIHTLEQLQALGVVRAFVQVKGCGACASLNLLWAIEGGDFGKILARGCQGRPPPALDGARA
ncbi:TfoX/Sxy family DNA transformation protein [Methylococcus mesophilus]|uniref:TfoX/Sxy family DNA transformation protein n=1 Tax=Methylococcus mesophilus TaxID=2993564 RepID=UPI0037436B74